MFCKKCGKEIDSHTKFCRYCGTQIISTSSAPFDDGRVDERKPDTREGMGKSVLIGIAVGLAVLAILAILWLVTVMVLGRLGSGGGKNAVQEYVETRARAGESEAAADELNAPYGKEPDSAPMEELSSETDETDAERAPAGRQPEQESQIPSETPAPEPAGKYILPESNSRYLEMKDLEGLTREECRLARNELYARHGRRFDDAGLQAYFDSCEWYHGSIAPGDFREEAVMNKYEIANRDLIIRYEAERGFQ
jgi:hypothetical protein